MTIIKTSFIYASFLCILVLCSSKDTEVNNGEKVNIVAFGEGRCSDTSFWMKWHWLPMWRMLGSTGRINFEYHPFGIKTTCVDSDSGDDVVCECHHGARECLLNQLQACVIEALPNFEEYMEVGKFLDMLVKKSELYKRNANDVAESPTSWATTTTTVTIL
ncbi:hypothetical protein B9Z55_005477 [Caenorhabditis nigoni]|uniref:Uncharacterized protein n=1 Tax=Caenorhabditis nigoni TaxID=1611254 RepID=A0A2G5V141_9PELO|nr:hypothetical protein B9Z55_005477 [Caenorhabditis nigoni]